MFLEIFGMLNGARKYVLLFREYITPEIQYFHVMILNTVRIQLFDLIPQI